MKIKWFASVLSECIYFNECIP